MNIKQELFALQDKEYKEFHAKLIPNVNPDSIIGIRTPHLRKLAKIVAKDAKVEGFLEKLPHQYYEENNLHGFIIEQEKDYDRCLELVEQFLPYVDNWATCDMMRPKVFKKNKEQLLVKIREWLSSEHEYTVRFGIEMLMVHYLDDECAEEYMEWVASVRHKGYYVKMMIAWYFATALAIQYEKAMVYIEHKRLEPWTHNKVIQKARESFRIKSEQKEHLKTLRIN